jgi:transposase
MLDVERITDLPQLQHITRLLQKENDRLHARLVEMTRELARMKGEEAQGRLALEIRRLEKQLQSFQNQLGKVSERRPRSQNGDEKPSPPKQRGHGPREQPRLLSTEKVHKLPPSERVCPACAGELAEMVGQFEESEEVTVVERQFVLVAHCRQKYRCRCNGAVVTAPTPPRLIPGGRYSLEFAVEVATAKYADHLPLDRQRRMMRRLGLRIDTQTLWDQIEALATRLAPAYDALLEHILASPQLGADETWWRRMDRGSRRKWWDWCLTTPDAVYHRIHEKRSAAVVAELLEGYEGTVMSDGYTAYETLARAGPGGYTQAHCWAHVRRKFVDLEAVHPEACQEILDIIGELYGIEHGVPDTPEAQELRRQVRDEQSREVVDRIRSWAFTQRASPQSGMRQAIDYMLHLWTGLTRFLDDPAVPLDNNATERAIRRVVLGRKNHYGSRSQRGTEVAALFYSLIETAELCGVDPNLYLLQAAHAALEEPGTVLLPHGLLPSPTASAA